MKIETSSIVLRFHHHNLTQKAFARVGSFYFFSITDALGDNLERLLMFGR